MERERVTVSIKKDLLAGIDQKIDGVAIRNRSHAFEHLLTQSLGAANTKNAVILVGGKGSQKLIPTIKQLLSDLKEIGLVKVYIALGSMAENIKSSLGDGDEFGLEIEYIENGQGTAGALLSLKKRFNDTFIVINPDITTTEIDLGKMIRSHKSRERIATVSTSDLTSLKGVYLFEPKLFEYIPREFSMLEDDIFPVLARNNELIVLPIL